MDKKGYGQGDARIAAYVDRVFQLDDPVLRDIEASHEREGLPTIQVSRFDGRIMELLARSVGAKKAVEIGTLAGYSAVHIMRGLSPDGLLYTFEYEPKHAKVAQANFDKHGYGRRVRLYLGSAHDRLPEIVKEGPFDLVFIDADKEGYPRYVAWAEENLRIGGIVLLDNAFAWGKVADPGALDGSDSSTSAIHAANVRLAEGGRFRAMMLPTGEGLAMGVKIR